MALKTTVLAVALFSITSALADVSSASIAKPSIPKVQEFSLNQFSDGEPVMKHPVKQNVSKPQQTIVKTLVEGGTKPIAKNSSKKPKVSLLQTWAADADAAWDNDLPTGTADAEASDGVMPMPQLSPALDSASSEPASSSQGLQTLSAAMKDSVPKGGGSTAAAMEAQLMNLLLGKSAFGATPMGGSVKKIHNILTKEMKPKVLDAHKADQTELNQMMRELKKCFSTRDKGRRSARPWGVKYVFQSRGHKTCRSDEAVQYSSKEASLKQQRALYQVKVLKCKYFASISQKFGATVSNVAVVTKAGSESVQSYIGRISSTICGNHVHGEKGNKKATGGWGGGLVHGFFDQYLKAKHACEVATKEYNDKVAESKRKIHSYNVRKGKCNQFQTLMDSQSCKHAVIIKDTCEQYAGCYAGRLKAFQLASQQVKMEERDRKAEWRGLTRIACLIAAFADGKVSDKEIDECKKKVVTTTHLIIKYPKIPIMTRCAVTNLYPATGAYKRREFAPLPTLAKGKASIACSGVESIPTKPAPGSPKSCKCRRVTLEGHYRAGPLVKCKGCLDVRRSKDKSSCPVGTKIFAPATRGDWQTFLNSAGPLGQPHWIIDITRPQNGCGGCTSNAMNNLNSQQKSWVTSDGSPWWLRSTKYSQPSGDYAKTCYLGLGKKKPADENSITFDDKGCNYHSKAYYCQKKRIWLTPKRGSPSSCKCSPITLASAYSPGALAKCEQCISVSKAQQKNSCPRGMKIFSPRSRADWKTFIISAQPLRAPNWIIDITRPQNGCGGCTKYPMNSKVPNQATWRTSDGSAWWLRSTRYSQPRGDYTSNCFMDLGNPTSENTVQFKDGRRMEDGEKRTQKCSYRSRSYYCQSKYVKPKPKKVKAAPTPSVRIVPFSSLKPGLKEEVYYFKQGKLLPKKWSGKTSNMLKINSDKLFRRPSKKPNAAWPMMTRLTDFAVRFTGILVIPKTSALGKKGGSKWVFKIASDDGSKLYIDKKLWANNDGLHGLKSKDGSGTLAKGQHAVKIEYFQKGGGAALLFMYKPPRSGRRGWRQVSSRSGLKMMQHPVERGLKEEIYYGGSNSRVPNLNKKADVMRIVPVVNYAPSKTNWKGFTKADNFAVRWSGELSISQKGYYKFSLRSDDGSRLFLDRKYIVNNDGTHGFRNREGRSHLKQRSYDVILEYFEKAGKAGMVFRYMGPGTGGMKVVPSKMLTARMAATKTTLPPARCSCIPCGSSKAAKKFGKGKCGPQSEKCSASKGTAKDGCYTSASKTCNCKTLKATR